MLLSLCIPTNGKVEWVAQVLDSIYSEKIDEKLFEVVITDNGEGDCLSEYIKKNKHENLKYYKSNSEGFLNQIDSFKKATGEFCKFVNHRNTLKKGTLIKLIEFVQTNIDTKPGIFFTNGNLRKNNSIYCRNLGEFLTTMGFYCTWSAGLGFWKQDFEEYFDYKKTNHMFPHFDILVFPKKEYIVNDDTLFKEVEFDGRKGYKYNFYYAFAVIYPNLLLQLVCDKRISVNDFNKMKKNNLNHMAYSYIECKLLKKQTDCDLTNIKSYMRIFYSLKQFYFHIFTFICSKILLKFKIKCL